MNYYEKEKKLSSQFTAVQETTVIAGCHGQNTKNVWAIGGIQNIKRTDEARKIREYLGNGIHLGWSKVGRLVLADNTATCYTRNAVSALYFVLF